MIAVRARSLALDAAPILVGATLTALASQISVPAIPVPFTLQTVAVLASGLVLGARRGALTQATYLLMGAAGLPVFAEMKAGPQWLWGATAGYLWAFVLVAALAGWGVERWKGWRLGLAIGGANLVLLTLGTLWLSLVLRGWSWSVGFLPFLPGAVAQSLAAWAVWAGLKPMRK